MNEVQEAVAEMQRGFGQPVRHMLTKLSVGERELRCKLLLEECIEFIEACGFDVVALGQQNADGSFTGIGLTVQHIEGSQQNLVEMADALGDVNVIINGSACYMGIDLEAVTLEIHESNMSKAWPDEGFKVNRCRHWRTEEEPEGPEETRHWCVDQLKGWDQCTRPEHWTDPNQPLGKGLKGPNYFKPRIAAVIGLNEGE